MPEPSRDLADADVLRLLRRHWSTDVDRVEHLAGRFGAHHWRAIAGLRPVLFATYDDLAGPRHTAGSLEAAYAGAAELAFRLDAVVAGLPTHDLRWTVPVASGALSATPWVEGERAGDGPPATRADAERTVRILARLHTVAPPRGLPRWAPLAPVDLGDRLADALAPGWTSGPLAAEAQALLRTHLADVRRWTQRYHRLAERAGDRPWVATHGEPHSRHQLVTVVRTLLVDWQSLKLAPRERDLTTLAQAGHADLLDPAPDPVMLELFDLERRLDHVQAHAARFAATHLGGADDVVALGGLRDELARP